MKHTFSGTLHVGDKVFPRAKVTVETAPTQRPASWRRLLLYVAGPYRDERGTAYVEENIRDAEAVAKCLWAMGFTAICPHANTRHFDGIVSSDAFIAGDLEIVSRCDGIVMLPRWKLSQGARQELVHAIQNDIPEFFWPVDKQELTRWAEAVTEVNP